MTLIRGRADEARLRSTIYAHPARLNEESAMIRMLPHTSTLAPRAHGQAPLASLPLSIVTDIAVMRAHKPSRPK